MRRHKQEVSTEAGFISDVFNKILKGLRTSDLKDFITTIASGDSNFLYQFVIRFSESSSLTPEIKYRAIVRSILQLASSQRDRNYEFRIHLDHLTDSARQMVETGNFLDSYFIARSIINEHSNVPENFMKDWNECLIPTFGILTDITKSEMASIDLKEKVFVFLLDREKETAFTSPLSTTWINTLVNSSTGEAQLQKCLEVIVHLLEDNRDHSGYVIDPEKEEQLLIMKMKTLEKSNRHDDVRHLLEGHRHVKFFLLRLIDESFVANDLKQARELIREGKKNEQRKGRINQNSEWDQLLLNVAQLENDKKAIRNLALQLFLDSDYNFEYYQLLKNQFEPGPWKAQIDKLTNLIRKQPAFASKGIHAIAQIFIEEKEWEKLLLLLQKNAHLELIEKYAGFLRERFPEQLLEVYRKAIRRFAEKYMGPEAYRIVTDTLKSMLSLPGGREIVQSLSIELKVNYRQRRAFVEELNKVIL